MMMQLIVTGDNSILLDLKLSVYEDISNFQVSYLLSKA